MNRIFNCKGYSLIELMAVISILGIVSGIAIVNMRVDPDVALKKCASSLVQDIRYIQQKSIYEKNTGYKIYADYVTNPNQYKIYDGEGNTKTITLDRNVYFVNTITGNYVKFDKTGNPTPPGNFLLKNSKGSKIQITIAFTTGRTKMTWL